MCGGPHGRRRAFAGARAPPTAAANGGNLARARLVRGTRRGRGEARQVKPLTRVTRKRLAGRLRPRTEPRGSAEEKGRTDDECPYALQHVHVVREMQPWTPACHNRAS